MNAIRFNRRDWLKVAVLTSTIIPFTLVVFFKLGFTNPFIIMIATGLAIVAAGYFLLWATESLQTLVSQAFALALLAIIQNMPEFSFEAILAWKRQLHFAAATMTGANRLLMGFGWPLIFFMAAFSAWRKGVKFAEIRLEKHQSVEIIFLLAATIYSLVLIFFRRISLRDSFVLIGIYAIYIFVVLHLPAEAGHCDTPQTTGKKLAGLKGWKKTFTLFGLVGFALLVICFGSEPFVESLKHVATRLGIPLFHFVQWFAPFLSEFPDSLTAFLWASSTILVSMGLANLISSKVNQWTLLIASIPIVYSLSLGRIGSIPLDTIQLHELMLTSAQTIYGIVCLLSLRFRFRHALILILLFFIQFFFTETRLIITWIYLGLALMELVLQRKEIVLFTAFKEVLSQQKVFTKKG